MQKSVNTDKTAATGCAGKYLTFFLADEVYGVPILKVQEIIGLKELTKVPKVPQYIKGVLNLRGKVIPVVDLRLKFDIEEKEDTRSTSIIIFQVQKNGSDVIAGVKVDSVNEVVDIKESDIEPTPALGMQEAEELVIGMAKIHSTVHMLIDMDRILNTDAILNIAE
ncbi:chemotaxis protein CheW [Desulfohalobium retbaense]|uniref:CheW protein n=1 Tax=Desulfohalobium retbaense (strain ATCC 49708 / DSM 5692 / JCM 16813 / HR100) TaxID=485915 RepID=C8X1C6_DESRD|nr:chemotaxis protein CheW [Desulfohalobium retbaense]ACV68223.1 CheW protein [Desulfohalobium retbaense DSM 5692]